ncbi:MAG TPA: hypothetical protein VIZ68_01505, partial [Thermoplasmata archaeon]
MHHGGRPRAYLVPAVGLALVALLLLVPGSSISSRGLAGASNAAAPASIGALSHCGGASVPGAYLGTLTVQGGGSSLPPVKNRTVVLAFTYELNFTPNGGHSIYSCKNGTATTLTGGTGGFSAALSIPSGSCNSVSCSIYTGPFGPLNVSVAGGPPPGYFLSSSVQGSTIGLAFVAALSRVSLDPTSRVTLSADAPTVVRATAHSGNGGPSPAAVSYAWRLVGQGWTLLDGIGSPNVTIEAADGASPGELEVWGNGTFNGTGVAAPPTTLGLAAASTTVTAVDVVPTTLDVGSPATFTVSGTGAGGYAYDAVIVPGLGEPDRVAPCTTALASGGLIALTCAVSLTYSEVGTAQPSGNLTNGYSTDGRFFAALTVSSALAVGVLPSPSVEYSNVVTPVTVSVAGGTGTGPFGPACVWPGDGRLLCQTGPGPTYAFPLSFGAPGTYAGRAAVKDSGGSNVSAYWETEVFARPSLDPLLSPSAHVKAGESLSITSAVSGGALPLTYWWNASSPAGTLYQGTTDSDGSLVLDFLPHASGPTTVTLTVVDALGSVLAEEKRLVVDPGDPVAVVPYGGPAAWSVMAGTPYNVSWAEEDSAGEVVASNETTISLALLPALGGRAVPLWVNTTQGPLAPDASGNFVLSGPDW